MPANVATTCKRLMTDGTAPFKPYGRGLIAGRGHMPIEGAAMFTDYGLSSGGGFFELAEAYLNFGPVGAVVIPFCISFVIARFYQRALTQMNLFYVFALSSLLSVWLRGSW